MAWPKGQPRSLETCDKIRAAFSGRDAPHHAFKKGNIPWTAGKVMPTTTRMAISQAKKGKTMNPFSIAKMTATVRKQYLLGERISPFVRLWHEHREKFMQRMNTPEWREHLRVIGGLHAGKPNFLNRGEGNPNWRGGITPEKKKLRRTLEWLAWRKQVFERDNYICRECESTKCALEPHHIVPLRSGGTPFDIKNGISLCRPCHQLTMGKEEQFVERYALLVA